MLTVGDEAMPTRLARRVLYPQQAGLALTTASLGAGGQLAEQLAAAELVGFDLDTGDELYWLLSVNDLLADFDLTKDLRLRLTVYQSSADSDTGFIMSAAIKGVAEGANLSDAKSSPDGSITFPAKSLTATAVNTIGPMAFNVEDKGFASDELLMLAVTCDNVGTASADEVGLLYVTLYGTRKIMDDSGVRQLT